MDSTTLIQLWQETLDTVKVDDGLDCDATYRPRHQEPSPDAPWTALLKSHELYQPGAQLGRGGMGAVYRARQSGLDRDVAVKILHERRSSSVEAARRDFLAEATVLGQLEHPNVVPVHGLGTTGQGALFVAMKLIDGRPWSEQLLGSEGSDLTVQLGILLQVCNGVAFAHSRGILHNDLKPANVMLGRFGEVLVVDWGLAVCVERQPDTPGAIPDNTRITLPCGTPAYMSPELAHGDGARLSESSDVYLLGAILYQLLCGKPPRAGGSFVQTVLQAAEGRFLPLPEDLPADLRAACLQALSPRQEDRQPDVARFQTALRDHLAHRESLTISAGAARALAATRQRGSTPGVQASELYASYAAAVAGFQQAQQLWEANPQASAGLQQAGRAFAEEALRRGDLGLAEAQLAGHEDAQDLRDRLAGRLAERQRAARSARRLRVGLMAAVTSLVCGLLLGIVLLALRNQEVLEHSQQIEQKNLQIESEKDRVIEEQRLVAQALQETLVASQQAEARGAIAEEALESLSQEVRSTLTRSVGDASAYSAARALLEVAMVGWKKLRDADLEQGRVSRGTARAQTALADLLQAQGAIAAATEENRAALRILETLADDPLRHADVPEELAATLRQQAGLYAQVGEIEAARLAAERARALLEALIAAQPGRPSLQRQLAGVLETEALMLRLQDKWERALQTFDRSLAIRRSLERAAPTAANSAALAGSLMRAADAYMLSLHYREAARLCDEALELHRQLFAQTQDLQLLDNLCVNLQVCGDVAFRLEDLNLARSYFDEAQESASELQQRNPARPRGVILQVVILLSRGQCEDAAGRLEAARAWYRQALELARLPIVADCQENTYQSSLLRIRANYAELLMLQGHYREAHLILSEAVTAARSLRTDLSAAVQREDLARCLRLLTRVCLWMQDYPAAEEAAGPYLQLERENPYPQLPLARYQLARALILVGELRKEQGAYDDALVAFDEALALRRAILQEAPDFPNIRYGVASALGWLANVYDDLQQDAQAEACFEEALRLHTALYEEAPRQESRHDLCITYNNWAVHRSDSDPVGAEELYAQALPLARQNLREDPRDMRFLGIVNAILTNLMLLAEQRGASGKWRTVLAEVVAELDAIGDSPAAHQQVVEHLRGLRDAAVRAGQGD